MCEGRRGAMVPVLFLAAVLAAVVVFGAAVPRAGAELVDELDELLEEEISAGLYYRLVDEDGRDIMQTGRRIEVGDQYLDAGNRLYEVVRVEDRVGHARLRRTIQPEPRSVFSANGGGGDGFGALPVQGLPNRRIAVYHTHNDECYVPARGTPRVDGRGDVHVIGRVFQEKLEEQGVKVIHNENIHLPHDRGAYRRARSTVLELLEEEPDAIFDIHRDAAPWYAYAERVDGEWLAQIMFVVGRQNPHFAVNRSFAFDLKAFLDETHPGLIRGVFIANGNYNQDLHPLKLLLEVGAHENTRRAATEGIACFADGVRAYLYGPAPGRPERAPIEGQSRTPAWRDFFLVLFLVGAAGGGFYLLNYPEATARLREKLKAAAAAAEVHLRRYFDRERRR